MFGNSWLLMIMLSVGPFSGQYNGENDVWLHVRMHTEGECRQAVGDIMRTHHIFQHLNPTLKVDAVWREESPARTYEESSYLKHINYRQCLDMFNGE
jgi:hypothetical protein